MTVNLTFNLYNNNGIYPPQLARNNEVVHITGNETINGTKIFLKDIRQETNTSTAFQGVTCKNYGFDLAQTNLNNERGARVISLDKNGDYFGAFQTMADSSKNYIQSCMFARRKVNGKDSTSSIWVGVDNSGNIASYAPNCAKVNSIVNTAGILKAANGYVKFGNGIILQWGSMGAVTVNSTRTVTFNTNFTATPRVFTNVNGSWAYCPVLTVTAINTSNFTVLLSSNENKTSGCGAYWFAIGY